MNRPHADPSGVFSRGESAPGGAEETEFRRLFGPDVEAKLVLDARVAFGEPFSRAIRAQFAALPNGETVLLAVFKDSAEAGAAWGEYLRRTGLGRVRGEGDLDRGYAVTRPVGDRALALRLHNTLGVWTGASDAAIRRRMQAGGFAVPGPVPPTPPPPITPG